MTQVSILQGIYSDAAANFITSYPINLQPVIDENGLSHGFLRSAPGITLLAMGPGADRGGINWNGVCYRVMGTKLIKVIAGVVTVIGDVGAGGDCTFDYGFTYLAITSNAKLYLYNGVTLAQVTDVNLGAAYVVLWVDGYYMTTDGTSLVVTELNDPFTVNPLKYGGTDADPSFIIGLRKVRNEVYVLNQYSIENFQNVGGAGFPFQRNVGGFIPKGCAGSFSTAYFLQSFAFAGGGRGEAISIYLADNGSAMSLSTPQVDRMLAAVPYNLQQNIALDSIVEQNEQRLLVHLPGGQTLVYSHQATLKAGSPVWHILGSGAHGANSYVGRRFIYAEGKWICGSLTDASIGYLDETVETQFGVTADWQFDTSLLYNGGRGGLLRAVELVGLPGRAPAGVNPTAYFSMTLDGQNWGTERSIAMGSAGQTQKRMQWRPQTKFSNYAGLRFRGSNTGLSSFARLEATIEPLGA